MLGTLITLVVSVIAVIPPIVHFFTGPIAPAIGGFAARRFTKMSDNDVLIMGGLLVVLAGVPAYLFLRDVSFLDGVMVYIASLIAGLYVGGLSTFAALFAAEDEEPEATTEHDQHETLHAD